MGGKEEANDEELWQAEMCRQAHEVVGGCLGQLTTSWSRTGWNPKLGVARNKGLTSLPAPGAGSRMVSLILDDSPKCPGTSCQ